MRRKRSPSREVYSALQLQKLPSGRRRRFFLLAAAAGALVLLLISALYLRRLSGEIALSDAQDAVTLAINNSVAAILERSGCEYNDFVKLQKDADGNISAITTDTARITRFSTEMLDELVRSADSQCLEVCIPLGNLTGFSLLLGKGPEIPVEIIMLTSSFVSCESRMEDTGINQSRHSIVLKADVDIDILLPWETVSTTVESEILLAETLIVGRVPETYVNVTEDNYGSSGSEKAH